MRFILGFGYRKSKKSTIFTAQRIFFLMKRAVRAYYIWKMRITIRFLMWHSKRRLKMTVVRRIFWNIPCFAVRESMKQRTPLMNWRRGLWIPSSMPWPMRIRRCILLQAAMKRIFIIWWMCIWMRFSFRRFMRKKRFSGRRAGVIFWMKRKTH